MVPRIGIARVVNAILVVVKSLIRLLLKMRLRLHRGLSKEKRELLIGNILEAYNPDKH